MLILASLSGIQDYLFDVREAGGGQARALRYRSFRIQLMAECIALRLLEAAGAPYDRLLFCVAAKVCIDAADNSPARIDAIRTAVADLEALLLEQTQGRLRLAVVLDQETGDFPASYRRAGRALAVRKSRAFSGRNAVEKETWPPDSLIVRSRWDADSEANRDADLGRSLVDARWLAVETVGRETEPRDIDSLGLWIRFDSAPPKPSPRLLSCSNLYDTVTSHPDLPRNVLHPRRLARHIPRTPEGAPVEFLDLAHNGARGAPMLGVLKADADSLGAAIAEILRTTRDAKPLKLFSDQLDQFFAGKLEAEKSRPNSPWADIYTVFSGGDDLLAVGPWNVMLDFAGHMRNLFEQSFGSLAKHRQSPVPLTLSAGIALTKPRYPIHLAAEQAEDLLELAKRTRAPRATQPKDQCSALGETWKWNDHATILGAGKQLADWVDSGVIQRTWLHTLLELALLRRSRALARDAETSPLMATSRLAYHIGRNWPERKPSPKNEREIAGGHARNWIDTILREFDQYETTDHVETIYLTAILRYALLATRAGSLEDVS
jgi:CRISPR-associated protein Csm1